MPGPTDTTIIGLGVQMFADTEDFVKSMTDARKAALAAENQIDELVKKAAGDLKEVGETLYGTGMGLVGRLQDYVMGAASVEQSLSGLERTAGLGEASMGRMLDQVTKLSSALPVSAEELARATAQIGQLNLVSRELPEEQRAEQLLKLTEVAAKLGVTIGQSTGQTANQLAQLMRVTKLTADDAGRLGSVITGLSATTGASASELFMATQRMGGFAKSMNITIPQVAGLASMFRTIGLDAGRGTNLVMQAFQQMRSKGDVVANALGITKTEWDAFVQRDPFGAFLNMLRHVQELQKKGGATEFLDKMGLKGRAAFSVVLPLAGNIDQLSRSVQQADGYFKDSTELEKQFATQTTDLLDRLAQLTSSMRAVALKAGAPFLDMAKAAVNVVIELTQRLFDLPTPVLAGGAALMGIAGGLLAITAAAPLAISYLLSTFLSINRLIIATKLASTQWAALTAAVVKGGGLINMTMTAISANAAAAWAWMAPWLPWLAAFAAAAVVAYFAWRKLGPYVMEFFKEVGSAIEILQPTIDALKELFGALGAAAWAFMEPIVEALGVVPNADGAFATFGATMRRVAEWINSWLVPALEYVTKLVKDSSGWIHGLGEWLASFSFSNVASGLWEMVTATGSVFDGLERLKNFMFGSSFLHMNEGIQEVIDFINTDFLAAIRAIADPLGYVRGKLSGWLFGSPDQATAADTEPTQPQSSKAKQIAAAGIGGMLGEVVVPITLMLDGTVLAKVIHRAQMADRTRNFQSPDFSYRGIG